MRARDWKVGDKMVHVEYSDHEVMRVTIVRETPTQWVDSHGCRWRKADGASLSHGSGCGPRSLVPAAEFDAAKATS